MGLSHWRGSRFHCGSTCFSPARRITAEARRTDGVGVNGQAHGSYSVDFFRRKSVGMSYVADSLIVFAVYSEIDGRMREDLFMNSRDRLRNTLLARELQSTISTLLKTQPDTAQVGEPTSAGGRAGTAPRRQAAYGG